MTPTSHPARRHLGTTLMLTGATLALLGMARTVRPSPAKPATMRIVALDYRFELPATQPAGATRIELVNRGTELHHAQLLHLLGDKTVADLAALPHDGPPPAWAVPVGGPNAVIPGDSSQVIENLVPGNYAVICVIPGADHLPHMMKGMVAGFTVTPSLAGLAKAPKADLSMRLKDYGFTPSGPIKAGHHLIEVFNDATQPHELVLIKLAPGKVAADVAAWEAGGEQGPPPGRPVGGIVAIAPGTSGMVETTLEAGSYAMVCFVPDAKDGQPHLMHGMLAPLTVEPSGR